MNPILMTIKAIVSVQLSDRLEALLILPGANAGLKSWMLLRNKRQMNRLETILDQLDAYNERADQQLVIAASVRFANKLFKFTGSMYVCTVTFLTIAAFSSSEPVLLMEIWLPFDHKQSEWVHLCVLVYQTIVTSYLGVVLLAGDLYSSVMYIMLTAHLEVLRKRLLNLGRHTRMVGRKRIDRNEMNMDINNVELRKCIEIHRMCIE